MDDRWVLVDGRLGGRKKGLILSIGLGYVIGSVGYGFEWDGWVLVRLHMAPHIHFH